MLCVLVCRDVASGYWSYLLCPPPLCLLQMWKTSQSQNCADDVTINSGRQSDKDLLGPLDADSPMGEMDGSLSSLTNFDLSDKDVVAMLRECDLQTLGVMPPLDLCWDLLCDSDIFKVQGRQKFLFAFAVIFCKVVYSSEFLKPCTLLQHIVCRECSWNVWLCWTP